MRNDNKASESTSMTIRDSNNKELGEALIADGAVLAAGMQPEARVNSEAGEKALIEALNTEGKADKHKPKKEKKEKTEKAEPATLDESSTQPNVCPKRRQNNMVYFPEKIQSPNQVTLEEIQYPNNH